MLAKAEPVHKVMTDPVLHEVLPIKNNAAEKNAPQPPSPTIATKENEDKPGLAEESVFSSWREKIAAIFNKKNVNDDESKITFNQGYENDIIHNAFFIVPPNSMLATIRQEENAPVAQSDIFATILDLMQIKSAINIDGLSLLKTIPKDRLRISTGFVSINDNIPEAEVTLADKSSYFIDFSRRSISLTDGKTVLPLKEAPAEILDLFKGKIDNKILH